MQSASVFVSFRVEGSVQLGKETQKKWIRAHILSSKLSSRGDLMKAYAQFQASKDT